MEFLTAGYPIGTPLPLLAFAQHLQASIMRMRGLASIHEDRLKVDRRASQAAALPTWASMRGQVEQLLRLHRGVEDEVGVEGVTTGP